jgi:hypothetical protein
MPTKLYVPISSRIRTSADSKPTESSCAAMECWPGFANGTARSFPGLHQICLLLPSVHRYPARFLPNW